MNRIAQIKSLTESEIDAKLNRVSKVFADIPIVLGKGNYPYSLFSLTDYVPPLNPELVEDMADLIVFYGDFEKADLLVSEADRGGGPLTHAVALRSGLPYSLANWYPHEAPGETFVTLSTAFAGDGFLCLNGVTQGSRVILVDDLLSSGGTALALVQAVEKAGGITLEAIFVGEKVDQRGREKLQHLNIRVTTLVRFNAQGIKTTLIP
jgi:adenine phosphoribosyltransferase